VIDVPHTIDVHDQGHRIGIDEEVIAGNVHVLQQGGDIEIIK
jgi:hypothetical protein